MLWPNASRPISLASKRTSGARISRAVASTMRMIRSGAACARQRSQTPRVSSAVTEPASSAVVRLSSARMRPATSTVSTPAPASAMAAVRPAGPPPTTTTSAVRFFMPQSYMLMPTEGENFARSKMVYALPPRAIINAFAVHVFTASGAALALLALIAAVDGRFSTMFLCLGAALVVDGVDGAMARRVKVTELLPRWSGDVLDLVVDFLTYVFVPAYAIVAGGLLPDLLAIPAAIVIV